MDVARTSPISAPEKQLLMALVEEENILKNLATDGKIVLLKRQAWARIEQHFNSQNLGPKRTAFQLKKCWERLKVKAKHEKARVKKETMKTGGGHHVPDVGEESQKVLGILGDDVDDTGSKYDSDAGPSNAKSHRQGRLIRFIKSLCVRAYAYTSQCEVLSMEVLEEDDTPQHVIISTPRPAVVVKSSGSFSAAQPQQNIIISSRPAALGEASGHMQQLNTAQKNVQSETTPVRSETTPAPVANPTVSGKRRKGRRSLFDGDVTSMQKDDRHQKFLEKRESLLELQMKEIKMKLKEAEIRIEIANIEKQIALKNLGKHDGTLG